jgi:hypothetical protein
VGKKVELAAVDVAAAQRAVELIEYVLIERKAELAHAIVVIGVRDGDIDELASALDEATANRRIAIDAYLTNKSPRDTVYAARNAAAEYRQGLVLGKH